MLLKKYIRSYLNEAKSFRPKPKIDHKILFDNWLQTVFRGAVENFEPFVKAVYKSAKKKRELREAFDNLCLNKGKINQPENVLIDYLKGRVAEEGMFKKSMLGDFFLENSVCPSDVYYILRTFIVPKKDFSKFNPHKVPSSLPSSSDFAFVIDESKWSEVKGMGSTQDWSKIWGSGREELKF
jgi:hypothetical protein